MYKVRLGFKLNHKVPVQVQVECKKILVLVWSWCGESVKSLAQRYCNKSEELEEESEHMSNAVVNSKFKF